MHYGQQLEYCTLAQMWNELKVACDFLKVREEVDEFNLHSRWKKRGVAMIPTKFGISFTTKFMNQVTFETICLGFSLTYSFCIYEILLNHLPL